MIADKEDMVLVSHVVDSPLAGLTPTSPLPVNTAQPTAAQPAAAQPTTTRPSAPAPPDRAKLITEAGVLWEIDPALRRFASLDGFVNEHLREAGLPPASEAEIRQRQGQAANPMIARPQAITAAQREYDASTELQRWYTRGDYVNGQLAMRGMPMLSGAELGTA